jgi:proteic killer suppression protein
VFHWGCTFENSSSTPVKVQYHTEKAISPRCAETDRIFNGKFSKSLPQAVQKTAARKLEILEAARELEDLRILPGNRLEALAGSRVGQWSILIND